MSLEELLIKFVESNYDMYYIAHINKYDQATANRNVRKIEEKYGVLFTKSEGKLARYIGLTPLGISTHKKLKEEQKWIKDKLYLF